MPLYRRSQALRGARQDVRGPRGGRRQRPGPRPAHHRRGRRCHRCRDRRRVRRAAQQRHAGHLSRARSRARAHHAGAIETLLHWGWPRPPDLRKYALQMPREARRRPASGDRRQGGPRGWRARGAQRGAGVPAGRHRRLGQRHHGPPDGPGRARAAGSRRKHRDRRAPAGQGHEGRLRDRRRVDQPRRAAPAARPARDPGRQARRQVHQGRAQGQDRQGVRSITTRARWRRSVARPPSPRSSSCRGSRGSRPGSSGSACTSRRCSATATGSPR